MSCFLLLVICLSVQLVSCIPIISGRGGLDPSPFPRNFLFGIASSSYQFEGAFLTDGRGNNWDNFTASLGASWMEVLGILLLINSITIDIWKIWISWTILESIVIDSLYHGQEFYPGTFGAVNWPGIDHYNKLINALLLKRIHPLVTLTRYNIPQELEDRYGGWPSHEVQEDFENYADICFENFGDRVKYWATFNEPNVAVIHGYRSGIFPPSRCSGLFGNCPTRDSETEPFIAALNIIPSHAAAVKTTELNIRFLDPIIFGNYPAEMHEILGSSLPVFSKYDSEKLKNGLDFIGINQYSRYYVKDCTFSIHERGPRSSRTEGFALWTAEKNGSFNGEPTDTYWLHVCPGGMERLVTYIKKRYNNIPIYITENGFGEKDNPNSYIEVVLNDVKRVEYMSSYLDALAKAVRKGADVRGHFVWSLLDNFEWRDGYTIRFGLHHVDYRTVERTRRLSAMWYKQDIARHKDSKSVSASA